MQTQPRLCIEGENLVPTSSRPACLEPRPGGAGVPLPGAEAWQIPARGNVPTPHRVWPRY